MSVKWFDKKAFEIGEYMADNVREIAKRAKVSAATVSRVMHQAENVKPETKERVEAAMRELGLSADKLVRSAKKENHVIGVLVPDLTNSFFIELIQGIEEIAEEIGIRIIICHTKESDKLETQYLRLLKDIHVGGIIITPTSDDDDSINNEYLNLLSNMKIPVVLLDRDVKYLKYSGIFIDNERGAFEATHLLLSNGHRKIALIGGPLNTVPGRGRRDGYINAFKLMDVPVCEDIMFEGDFSINSGMRITEQIIREHPDVSAIFSSNNHMTIGCLKKLQEMGLSVPKDISVVGFDDIKRMNFNNLADNITVVDRPTNEMGVQAIKIMNKILNGKTEMERRIILMPKMAVRGSEKLLETNRGIKYLEERKNNI